MSEEKQQIEEVDCKETRRFCYSREELSFDFEIDVSDPEIALAEISDFKDLMAQSFHDLEILGKEFASKIEKPKEKKQTEDKKIKKEIPLATAQNN